MSDQNVLKLDSSKQGPDEKTESTTAVTPLNIARLVKLTGTQARAAKKLFCSPSHISHSLTTGKVEPFWELAAEAVIARDYTPEPAPMPQAIITAPEYTLKGVRDLVLAGGGTFKEI